MKITGSGSRLSPIAIDDSEDEVLQELVDEAGFESSWLSPMDDQRDKVPRSEVLTNTSKGTHQKPSIEGKAMRKRKRSMNEAQSGSATTTSQQKLDTATHTQPGALSKKAKKRRRKLERLLQERSGQPPPPVWLNGMHHLAHELPNTRIMGGVGVRLDNPHAVSGPYPTYNAADSTSYQYNSEIPVASSSSSWVASMAMAAETPMSMLDGRRTEGWDSYSYSLNRSDHSQPPTANVQQFSEPISAPKPPPAPPPAITPSSAAPAAPPPTPIIGMKPDHDPSSKHGLFVIPPNATKGNTDLLSTKGNPYIPNPARTLVMEQLPKSHRTQDWAKNWSKSACGAYPVYSCIDHHGAKALVEFATAELARKAWSSPRLGAALTGLKTHQLKGRPREDLIKVWWYRVDGIGANAGVGEIEEGEIEGDVAEKEIEVPVKETKKERKARLLRERQARKIAVAAKPSTPLQHTSPVNGDATGTQAPNEVAATQSLSLSLDPAQYSQESKSGYPYYSITPQPLPRPLPHPQPLSAPHPPLSRAPLPPQSALEAQWRPKHELPKKPTRETILTAAASTIISTKTSPPIQPSPITVQPVPPPLSLPVTPTYEDMDVDDDMDLESPRTAGPITFNLTPAVSSQNQPDVLEDVSSSVSQVVRVAVPKLLTPSAISKTDVPSAILDSFNHTSVPLSDPESIANRLAPPSVEAVTSQSSSASGTPPLEPRAMKNVPKGPSFKIRSLLARQKELEERISKSKMELGIATTPVSPTPSVESPLSTTESSLQEDGQDKQAMEERLRLLVLRSQKNRSRSLASKTPTNDAQVPSPIPTVASPTSGEVATSTASTPHEVPDSDSAIPSVKTSTFSLDDLAVSFITETIETFKATPNLPMPTHSAAPAPAPGLTTTGQSQNIKLTAMAKQKLELAAQQKRLETQIAETKVLMMKFEKAKTKQERETILTAMREQSRANSISNDDDDPSTPTIASAVSRMTTAQVISDPTMQPGADNAGNNPPGYTTAHAVKKWPGSHEHDAGVLIVSDDEDEESEYGH